MRERWLIAALGVGVLLPSGALTQPERQPTPVPVAETALLMKGLAEPNLRALGRTLTEEPTAEPAWAFARGQALLIAETGNLLMMRPPRNQGQAEWTRRSEELRGASENLARRLAAKDYVGARVELIVVTNVCNRCHRTFQVKARVSPFEGDGP